MHQVAAHVAWYYDCWTQRTCVSQRSAVELSQAARSGSQAAQWWGLPVNMQDRWLAGSPKDTCMQSDGDFVDLPALSPETCCPSARVACVFRSPSTNTPFTDPRSRSTQPPVSEPLIPSHSSSAWLRESSGLAIVQSQSIPRPAAHST